MRAAVTPDRIRLLLAELGRRARGPGRIYLVGGATALLEGWRPTTADVDLKLDPEPAGIFEAIAEIKNELDINVELAAPDQFLPELPGWRERSRPIGRFGAIEVFHYDFYAQCLAKIERGHERDLADVRAMLVRGLVTGPGLRAHLAAIEKELIRFPAVEPAALRARLEAVLSDTR